MKKLLIVIIVTLSILSCNEDRAIIISSEDRILLNKIDSVLNAVNLMKLDKKDEFISHINNIKDMIKHQTIPSQQKKEISEMNSFQISQLLENIINEKNKFERYQKLQPIIAEELKNAKTEEEFAKIRSKYSEFFIADSSDIIKE